MTLKNSYLEDMKEYIRNMDESEFTVRGTTKETVLGNKDTMERLWVVYQKDVEEYDCDTDFSLGDAVNEVLGAKPVQKAASTPKKIRSKYRCPFCGSERFIGHQEIRADVYVGGNGEYEDNLPGGLEAIIYDSSHPYGPFTCSKCGREYDPLPENKQVRLPRGTFTVVSGVYAQMCKSDGYGYHHEDNGYTVLSNGTSALAVSNEDYNRYCGGQRSFML